MFCQRKTAAFRFLPETDDVVLGLAGGGGSRSAMAWRIEPTVCLPFGRRAKGPGEILSLHNLLTFGNA